VVNILIATTKSNVIVVGVSRMSYPTELSKFMSVKVVPGTSTSFFKIVPVL